MCLTTAALIHLGIIAIVIIAAIMIGRIVLGQFGATMHLSYPMSCGIEPKGEAGAPASKFGITLSMIEEGARVLCSELSEHVSPTIAEIISERVLIAAHVRRIHDRSHDIEG